MQRAAVIAGLGGLLLGGAGVALATGQFDGASSPERARTEAIVRAYLLDHPEIIPEAMERLQQRQLAGVVSANRAAYETPFAGAWAGAADADVTLVQFYDYACGFCAKSNGDIDRLLAEDKRLKVVWREFPVLGEPSVAAAEASLAAARQGKFRQFHAALFKAGRPTPAALASARAETGIAAAPAGAEIKAEIARNYELGTAIGNGTPLFIVGDRVLQGAVGYEALKAAVAEARAKA